MAGGLLLVNDFRSLARSDFPELRERTQARGLGITRAAAGGAQQSESGNDKCGGNTDHGMDAVGLDWKLENR